MGWYPCEYPERPYDDDMLGYHLGFLRQGDDKMPCRGCVVSCEAAVARGSTIPGVLHLVAAEPIED